MSAATLSALTTGEAPASYPTLAGDSHRGPRPVARVGLPFETSKATTSNGWPAAPAWIEAGFSPAAAFEDAAELLPTWTALDLHNARAAARADLQREREIDAILSELSPAETLSFDLGERPSIARISVTAFVAKNWYTTPGADMCARDKIERMPANLENCRFFTRTYDPSPFRRADGTYDCAAIHAAERNHRRMFFRRLRRGCWLLRLPDGSLELARKPRKHFDQYVRWRGCGDAGYFTKLELMESGIPHWHDIFAFLEFIPLEVLKALWHHGTIEVDRVRGESYKYLLKYVTKPVAASDDEDPFAPRETSFPDWVLDHQKTIRFTQSSKGFLKPLPKSAAPAKSERPTRRRAVRRTIRAKLAFYKSHVRVWGERPWPVVRRLTPGKQFGDLLVAAAYIAGSGGGTLIPNNFRISEFPAHVAAEFIQ